MSDRANRVVLTTGSNSGIGLATTIEAARLGFRSVGSVRSEAKAEAVQRAAGRAGVGVETVLLDVNDAERCAQVVDELRPWGLVNNAGFGGMGAVEDVGDDEARELMETMVMAPMRLARLAAPHMRAAGGGRVVNMSSVFGRTTAPLAGWYCGAKHALEALSDSLRMEVAAAGIKVILVEPGGFKTGIWGEVDETARSRPGSNYERAYQRSGSGLRLTQPFMGNPERVAAVVGRALTSRFPSERYLVGIDAVALTVTQRLTPTVVRDRITRLGLGL
ncbi:MAG TPA: SDR family NAD(P)-dependent oxidoreductase [Acidimicrobiales bacterium]|nr:SDR family NAD(P)-dependent oxidoreductase [Acidimicrobiales bacterium]